MTPDGYDLSGRVAIVTGGGEGIGAATAGLLARYGADIAIAGRTSATLDKTSREIAGATGRRCIAIPTDARDEAQVERMVACTMEHFGQIDILINVVGWSGSTPLSKMSTETWKGDFELNIDTAFLCSRAAVQHMMARRSGAMVNVSSVAGTNGVKGMAAYSSAKAALVMFTRVAAAEWGHHGIRVNCVAPGLIATANAMKVYDAAGMDVNQFCAPLPVGRAGTAEDVARAIVFLASDASSYITGETLEVSGGPNLGGGGD